MSWLSSAGTWLRENALGLLGAGGAMVQNRAAREQAREMMRFQERMSSTAAQRSVADYVAAGLNPALAYDRPASSPGGSQAPVENAVSSGLAAKQAAANIELTRAQALKANEEAGILAFDRQVRSVTVGDDPSWYQEQMARRKAALRDMAHVGALQPHDERLRALDVLLKELSVPRSQLMSGVSSDVGAVRDFIKSGVSDAKGAAAALRAWMSVRESIAERDRLAKRRIRQ